MRCVIPTKPLQPQNVSVSDLTKQIARNNGILVGKVQAMANNRKDFKVEAWSLRGPRSNSPDVYITLVRDEVKYKAGDPCCYMPIRNEQVKASAIKSYQWAQENIEFASLEDGIIQTLAAERACMAAGQTFRDMKTSQTEVRNIISGLLSSAFPTVEDLTVDDIMLKLYPPTEEDEPKAKVKVKKAPKKAKTKAKPEPKPEPETETDDEPEDGDDSLLDDSLDFLP